MLELGWGTPSLVTARHRRADRAEPDRDRRPGDRAAAAAGRQVAGAAVPADGHRRRCRVRSAEDLVRRLAARLARALHLADRPVRVPRAVRRPAEFPDQRRRLSSALHRHPARHSGAVPARRRRVLDRHRRHASSRATSRSRRRRCRAARRCACGATSASRRSKAASSSTRSSTSSRSSASKSTSTSGPVSRCSTSTSQASTSTACSPDRDAGTSSASATIHTPWPLPDFSFHVDETWGEDRATPVRKLRLVDELRAELEAHDDKGTPVNWSAVLPVANDGFVTLIKLPPAPGLLRASERVAAVRAEAHAAREGVDQARLGRHRRRKADRDRRSHVRRDHEARRSQA